MKSPFAPLLLPARCTPLRLCKHLAPSGVCTALPCAPGSKNKIPICVRGTGAHARSRYVTQVLKSHWRQQRPARTAPAPEIIWLKGERGGEQTTEGNAELRDGGSRRATVRSSWCCVPLGTFSVTVRTLSSCGRPKISDNRCLWNWRNWKPFPAIQKEVAKEGGLFGLHSSSPVQRSDSAQWG